MRLFHRLGALLTITLTASIALAAWLPDGTRITSFHGFVGGPRIAADEHGGAFLTWNAFAFTPYIERITQAGEPAIGWPPEGRAASAPQHPPHNSSQPAPVSDGMGGCYVLWVPAGEFCTESCAGEPGRIRIQRLTPTGDFAAGWPAEGIPISSQAANPRVAPLAAPDGRHGVLIAWGTVVQRVGPHGELRWGDGVTLGSHASWQSVPQVVADGQGGALVFWSDGDGLPFPSGRVFGQHVSPSGHIMWAPAGRPLSGRYTLGPGPPTAIATEAHGAVVAWSGVRGGDEDIFAARVTRSGALPWQADKLVCGAGGIQTDVHMVAEPRGRVLLAWRDARPTAGIFAQSLDRQGRALWQAGGVPVCPGAGNRIKLVLARDGAGGAYLAWGALAGESEVFASRILSDGTQAPGWPALGAPLCTPPADLPNTQIEALDMAATGSARAMVVWQDLRHAPGTEVLVESSFAMLLQPGGPAAVAQGGTKPIPVPIASGLPESGGAQFSLHGAVPNPSFGNARIRFSLADDSPATLETFDIAGRRIAERRLAGHAGENDLPLTDGRRSQPGVYLVRLMQHGRAATSRVVVLP